jgi:4a-hydroxytetrahydrobiopterin dehydratase
VAAPKLTSEEIQEGLKSLTGWTVVQEKLHREYKFADFAHAMGFMAIAAPKIEKRDHHPEWANVYNRVTIDLATHDSGGITKKDLDLAIMLEGIAKKLL